MDYRPSRSFLILMSAFTVCGVAGGWGWNRINSAPNHIRVKGNLWEMLTYEPKPAFEPPGKDERVRIRARATLMKEELVHRHPRLAIETVTLPAERNGFLRLLLLTGNGQAPNQNVSRELAAAMEDDAPKDAEKLRALLAEHRPLVAELRAIGELRERSSDGMPDDYIGFISGREFRNLARVMLHSARLAAMDGDAEQALRDVRCVSAMASIYQEVEGTNLLLMTLAIVADGMVRDWVLQEIVPVLGPDGDLRPWRELLAARAYEPRHFSHTVRGEWHQMTGTFLLPILLSDRPDNPPDVEELMEVFASQFSDHVEWTAGASLADLKDLPGIEPSAFSQLSPESREVGDLMVGGSGKWGNGFVREAVRQRMGLAAMDLIILERSGAGAAGADVMERLPRNPLNGAPFRYDPATRTVSGSAEDENGSVRLPG